MNVISHAADVVGFCAEFTANGCQIRVHARPDFAIQP